MSFEKEANSRRLAFPHPSVRKGILLSKLIEAMVVQETVEGAVKACTTLVRQAVSAVSLTIRLQDGDEIFSTTSDAEAANTFPDLKDTPIHGTALYDHPTPAEPFHFPITFGHTPFRGTSLSDTENSPRGDIDFMIADGLKGTVEWVSADEQISAIVRNFLSHVIPDLSHLFISKIRERQRQLEAEERVKFIQRIFGAFCHDVGGALQLLVPENQDFVRHASDQLEGSVEAYRQLVRSGRITHQTRDLTTLTTQVIEEFRSLRQVQEKAIHFEPSFSGDLRGGINDAFIRSVLQNLLSDALSFAPARSTITVRGSREFIHDKHRLASKFLEKWMIHLVIEDQGPGIPDEIFRNLFSKEISGREGGHGNGLRSVYDIVTNYHNGDVQCETKPGKGTTFHVYLPAIEKLAGASSSRLPAMGS